MFATEELQTIASFKQLTEASFHKRPNLQDRISIEKKI